MSLLVHLIVACLGYLLGSIPTGYLVARSKGIDIRATGSGNIGATNVLRVLGRPLGVAVLLFDFAKGLLAVVLLPLGPAAWLPDAPASGSSESMMAIAAGLGAILGHNYTVWLRFKGGKGIATTAGVLTGLLPWTVLILLGIWFLVLALTRYVSLASVVAAFCLPWVAWWIEGSLPMIGVALIMAVLAIYRHRSNLRRLWAGTEPRLGAQKQSEDKAGTA